MALLSLLAVGAALGGALTEGRPARDAASPGVDLELGPSRGITGFARIRTTTMGQVIEGNDANFETEVLQSETPVLVDFSATWCGPCKKLEPIVHELADDYEGRLKVVKVVIDKAPMIASKFGILSVPTLLLIQEGQVRDQLVGLQSKANLADRVDKVL